MKKKTHPNDSPRARSCYSSYEELRKHFEEAPAVKIAICMDKHLLAGATLTELLIKAEENNKRLGGNDFRTPSRIKTHITYRRNYNNWIIEENSIGEFKIVGYRQDIDEELKSTHMKRVKEFTTKS